LLRAALALATLGFALAVLRASGRASESLPWAAFAFTLVGLYVLERFGDPAARRDVPGDRRVPVRARVAAALAALPVLAVLWVNLHGIEYPVMLLILGAYLFEWGLARIDGLRRQSRDAARDRGRRRRDALVS
jgi:hypothetical protein